MSGGYNGSLKMCQCGHFKQEHTMPPFLGCDSCKKCDCFMGEKDFCDFHEKHFERIEDRQEHFEEENADAFGCSLCYVLHKMEGI